VTEVHAEVTIQGISKEELDALNEEAKQGILDAVCESTGSEDCEVDSYADAAAKAGALVINFHVNIVGSASQAQIDAVKGVITEGASVLVAAINEVLESADAGIVVTGISEPTFEVVVNDPSPSPSPSSENTSAAFSLSFSIVCLLMPFALTY